MSKAKVLFVDDCEDVINMMRLFFEEEEEDGDLEIKLALSGKEALDILAKDEGAEILVVVSDINMPEMDGFELLEIVKNKYDYITQYMCSAYGRQDYKDRASLIGVKRFFNKPLDINELKHALKDDLSEHGQEVKFYFDDLSI
jgi:CheY-like chemotaxis protein